MQKSKHTRRNVNNETRQRAKRSVLQRLHKQQHQQQQQQCIQRNVSFSAWTKCLYGRIKFDMSSVFGVSRRASLNMKRNRERFWLHLTIEFSFSAIRFPLASPPSHPCKRPTNEIIMKRNTRRENTATNGTKRKKKNCKIMLSLFSILSGHLF